VKSLTLDDLKGLGLYNALRYAHLAALWLNGKL